MSSAIYNNMTIIIDIINNSKSIFKNDEYIISIYESIDFVGYLIIYDKKESETINININDILTFINLKIYEDYNNLPLRYNEAGLVKYLEKNSIGRPSTYTSIISKILERNYVEIKDIKGTTFNSNIYEIDNKYILKEYTKEINIGNEYKKIVPTENGIKVNDFMLKYFDNIIDIDFTAKLELLLDKIAIGQANWITVLQNFYSNFEPIINNLNIIPINTNTNDNLLGEINNQQIFKGTGKYGPYVKTYLNNKWIFSSIKDNININIEDAYELLQYPKYICKIKNKDIYLNKGKYGYYINYNNKNYSVKNNDIDINDIKKLLNI
jgi:DNA topoisomerase-1